MIHHLKSSEKTKNIFLSTFKTLGIASMLRKASIRKDQGHSTYEVFKFLLLLVFQEKNLFRFLESKRSYQAVSKNTYYRFLNNSTYNWRKFLSLLSAKVISAFSKLTRADRVNVLILDDSIVPRGRSKKVELLAKVFDHTSSKYQKGFTMLTLGWSDGYSFVPTDFAMLSSSKSSNRLNEVDPEIDKRTNGFKRRKEAMSKKTNVAVDLIKNTLTAGICADYVLMDTWFTHEPLIQAILEQGLHVIGMVKQLKQKYRYNDKYYTMKELKRFVPKRSNSNILGSLIVHTKNGIPVKLVYVVNRNKRSEWLVILSTDLSLSDDEVVRIYGNRWSIEVFFKSVKSLMKLGSEFQGRSYDQTISHTTIVYSRYILLEWFRREERDERTFGEIFYIMCDDIRDMDLETALQNLMSLFVEQLNIAKSTTTNSIKCQLQHWISEQASFIKVLFADLCWES
tara:strand:- start:2 stop:1360 length:1359 start_codon:yes stop_codon:yes gene_type:complete